MALNSAVAADGGVIGTMALLSSSEQQRIIGFVINRLGQRIDDPLGLEGEGIAGLGLLNGTFNSCWCY